MRFFTLPILFIFAAMLVDVLPLSFSLEYIWYIVHHSLLTAMNSDSISLEVQTAIDKLRKDSIAKPFILSDNGSPFIAMEFRIVLKQNNITQKLIKPDRNEKYAADHG